MVMETYDFATLDVALDEGVAFVTISNPPLNVLDAALLQDLDGFAGQVRDDTGVRVIVFQSGDPEFFIPHGNMHFVDDPEAFASLQVAMDEDAGLNPLQRVFERVRKLPQVTVGKLAGYARGGGSLDGFVATLAYRIAGLAPGVIAAAKAAVDAPGGSVVDALRTQNEQLGRTVAAPAAAALTRAALAAGAQTREGERDLEALLNGLQVG